jgi:hypothetical protein
MRSLISPQILTLFIKWILLHPPAAPCHRRRRQTQINSLESASALPLAGLVLHLQTITTTLVSDSEASRAPVTRGSRSRTTAD